VDQFAGGLKIGKMDKLKKIPGEWKQDKCCVGFTWLELNSSAYVALIFI
jgi:hypothetical protein